MVKHHRHYEVLAKTVGFWFFSASFGLGLVIAISLLWSFGFLELKTIISVGVTDLTIGYLLYLLLGQSRRADIEEVVDLMDSVQRLAHLKVYSFSVWKTAFYYVENTTTKEYFAAPDFIENMVDRKVIDVIPCKSEKEMKAKLRESGSHLNDKEPTMIQLMAVKQRRKRKAETETKDI